MATEPETGQVMSYGDFVDEIARSTGLKKADVRKTLDAAQRVIAQQCRETVGNRVHFGRLVTFFSTQTKERKVNDPRNKGNHLISPSHVALRASVGTHTRGFMKGDRAVWESRA